MLYKLGQAILYKQGRAMLYTQGRASLYDQGQAMLYKQCRHGCTNLDFTEAAYMWPGLFYKQAGRRATLYKLGWVMLYKKGRAMLYNCINWAGPCCTLYKQD